jgi:hypothetical protein
MRMLPNGTGDMPVRSTFGTPLVISAPHLSL